MSVPPRHADVLRAIGELMGAESLHELTVFREQATLVTWRPLGTQAPRRRLYGRDELDQLRGRLRGRRGGELTAAPSFAELLRVLGQEAEQVDADLVMIIQEDDSFFLAGLSGAGSFSRAYSRSELLEISRQRRETRRS